MRKFDGNICVPATIAALVVCVSSDGQYEHHTSQLHAEHQEPSVPPDEPALPEGMTLEDVLDRAAQQPPGDWPDAIMDHHLRAFVLFEQLEYRAREEGADHIGWDIQGWVGYDYDKFW